MFKWGMQWNLWHKGINNIAHVKQISADMYEGYYTANPYTLEARYDFVKATTVGDTMQELIAIIEKDIGTQLFEG